MVYLRRVVGQSMLPTLRPGQVCVFLKTGNYQHGDIVLAKAEGRPVVKRVHQKEDALHLKGDNHQASTDYVITGRTRKNKIMAKLVWPKPVEPLTEVE